jgi:hypothetical protein
MISNKTNSDQENEDRTWKIKKWKGVKLKKYF